jgi:hypothetical protein
METCISYRVCAHFTEILLEMMDVNMQLTVLHAKAIWAALLPPDYTTAAGPCLLRRLLWRPEGVGTKGSGL